MMKFCWILVQLFDSAVSWGQEPHLIVAHIAAHFLPEDTALHIQNLLGFPLDYTMDGFANQLSSLGMWADQPEAAWSKYYHIAHTRPGFPEWDVTRDCGYRGNGVCLPTGIANWTSIASDPLQSPGKRQESVKFLLHVMADIHQPLHIGLWEDLGGNKIQNIYPSFTPGPWGDSYNLHQLWDRGLFLYWQNNLHDEMEDEGVVPWKALGNELVRKLRVTRALRYQYFLDSSSGDLTRRSVSLGLPTRIATETAKLAGLHAYYDENGVKIKSDSHLSEAYILSRVEVMKVQLAKAGFRLAGLLKDIVARATAEEPSPDNLADTLSRSLNIAPPRISLNIQTIIEAGGPMAEIVTTTARPHRTLNVAALGRSKEPIDCPTPVSTPRVVFRKRVSQPLTASVEDPTEPQVSGPVEVLSLLLPGRVPMRVSGVRGQVEIPRLVLPGALPGWNVVSDFRSVDSVLASQTSRTLPLIRPFPSPAILPVSNSLQCPFCDNKYVYPKALETHKGKCPRKMR